MPGAAWLRRRRAAAPRVDRRERSRDRSRAATRSCGSRTGAYAHIVAAGAAARVDAGAARRAQVTDLVYGTLRGARALDDLLAPLSTRATSSTLDPPVSAPRSASARTSCSRACPRTPPSGRPSGASPRRGAWLRQRVLRGARPARSAVAVAGRRRRRGGGDPLSYPDWIVDRLVADLGPEDARAALEVGNEPAPSTLRVEPAAEPTAGRARDRARGRGRRVGQGALVDRRARRRGARATRLRSPAVADGRATPQDQASQAVVDVLDPSRASACSTSPPRRVARPRPSAERVATDGRRGRGRRARRDGSDSCGRGATRLGLGNVAAVVADGRAPPGARRAVRPGARRRAVLRPRRPPPPAGGPVAHRGRTRRRARRAPARAAARPRPQAVRPGGVLVYSVCTLTAAETADVDDWAASRPCRASVLERRRARRGGPAGRGALLLPQAAGTDGMYVLVLRRGAGSVERDATRHEDRTVDPLRRLRAPRRRRRPRRREADLLHVDVMDGHFVPEPHDRPAGREVAAGRAPTSSSTATSWSTTRPCCSTTSPRPAPTAAPCTSSSATRGRCSPDARARHAVSGSRSTPRPPSTRCCRTSRRSTSCSFMSVHPGFGGQAFIPAVLDKVEAARRDRRRARLPVEIEIDGGIKRRQRALARPPRASTSSSPGARSSDADDPLPRHARSAAARPVTPLTAPADSVGPGPTAKVLTVSDGVADGTARRQVGPGARRAPRCGRLRCRRAPGERRRHRRGRDALRDAHRRVRRAGRHHRRDRVRPARPHARGHPRRDRARGAGARRGDAARQRRRRATASACSRGASAGRVGEALVCNLPGSASGAVECLEAVLPADPARPRPPRRRPPPLNPPARR